MDYPSAIPVTEIKAILDISRAGSFKENFQEFMHCAWVVQGYGQAMMIGAPEVAKQSALSPEQMLESIVTQSESGELVSQAAVSWKDILPYILKLAIIALQAI